MDWKRKILRLFGGGKIPDTERAKDGEHLESAENLPIAKAERTRTKPLHKSAISKTKRKKKRKKAVVDKDEHRNAFPKNKKGIRILTGKDDLWEIFGEGNPEAAEIDEKAAPLENTKKIRVLTHEDNLHELFGCESSETRETGEDFRRMLEQTLTGETFRTALREKKISPKPVSGKKYNRFPSPETELDLHGCTSVKAGAKVEYEIDSLRRKGVRTLRIIVGKGSHSHGKAVLPDIVEKKLAELKRVGSVSTFRWEKRSKLKSGAVIVWLSRTCV